MSRRGIVAGAVILVGVAALAAVAVAVSSAGRLASRIDSVERDQQRTWEASERADPNLEAVRDALRRERADLAVDAPGVEVPPGAPAQPAGAVRPDSREPRGAVDDARGSDR